MTDRKAVPGSDGAYDSYYSPQSICTRLFELDIHVTNLSVLFKLQRDKINELSEQVRLLTDEKVKRDGDSRTGSGELEKKADSSA